MRSLYPKRKPLFVCLECKREFTTRLGYSEHIKGAKRAGSHNGRQCKYVKYPYLCATADCERAGRMCWIFEEAKKVEGR